MGRLTPGQLATLACQLEVTAAKPGNVHRAADFEDVTLNDFLSSGIALGSAIDAQPAAGETGDMILSAAQATRWITQTNTNLGMILLICPLAKLLQRRQPITCQSIAAVIESLRGDQSRVVYEAIVLARPGGMGESQQMDVNDPNGAPESLLTAMQSTAQSDMIAKQYVSGFEEVTQFVLPAIEEGQQRFKKLSWGIVYAHVKTMAQFPDSLIARKLGDVAAQKSATIATQCLEQLTDQDDDDFWSAVGDLDFWLRSDGHRRNPGTTADMIAAALFIGLAENKFSPPFH